VGLGGFAGFLRLQGSVCSFSFSRLNSVPLLILFLPVTPSAVLTLSLVSAGMVQKESVSGREVDEKKKGHTSQSCLSSEQEQGVCVLSVLFVRVFESVCVDVAYFSLDKLTFRFAVGNKGRFVR